MKSNFFKYIFIAFIIGIAIYTIYILYFNENKQEQTETVNEISRQVEKITDLRFAISNFDSINPFISNNKEVLNIDKIIFEPLISLSEDYKLNMILAKECSKISDTSYIIKVDNNKKWHNGTAVTSNDVNFTIKILKQGNSIYSYNTQKILNTEVIDSETIKINLIEPEEFFEYNLTFPVMSSQYYINEDFYTSPKIPMGTGMFKISEITDSNIKLVKNENWWNKKNMPQANIINIKLCREIGETYNSFKMKNIDIFTTYNTNLENYIGTMGYYKQEVKSREFNYLSFNLENKVLKYKEVRQAINYCIDKTNLISSVFNNNVFEAKYPLDYGSYLYTEEALNKNYNIELARKVLAENRLGI